MNWTYAHSLIRLRRAWLVFVGRCAQAIDRHKMEFFFWCFWWAALFIALNFDKTAAPLP